MRFATVAHHGAERVGVLTGDGELVLLPAGDGELVLLPAGDGDLGDLVVAGDAGRATAEAAAGRRDEVVVLVTGGTQGIGAGPIGLTTALGLARYRVTLRVSTPDRPVETAASHPPRPAEELADAGS